MQRGLHKTIDFGVQIKVYHFKSFIDAINDMKVVDKT